MRLYYNTLKSNIRSAIGDIEELEELNSENDLYKFKLKIIGDFMSREDGSEIIKELVERRKITKSIDIFDLYSHTISLVITFNFVQTKKMDLIKLLTQISSFYLLKKIINPIKAYRVKKFIREKVDNECSNYQNILDGSIYLIDNVKNPELYMFDYEEIDFASFFDPPSLFIKNRKICTLDQRVEVFEMVPDNSNLIVEVRNVNLFAYEDFERRRPKFITLDQMGTIMRDFFNKLKTLIRGSNLSQFLEPCVGRRIDALPLEVLRPREQISFLSQLQKSLTPSPPKKSKKRLDKSEISKESSKFPKYTTSKISSIMDEYMRQRGSESSESPTMSSTLDDYLDIDSSYKRQSCQVMFRPKSKKSKK